VLFTLLNCIFVLYSAVRSSCEVSLFAHKLRKFIKAISLYLYYRTIAEVRLSVITWSMCNIFLIAEALLFCTDTIQQGQILGGLEYYHCIWGSRKIFSQLTDIYPV